MKQSPPLNEKEAYFLDQAKRAEKAAAKIGQEHKVLWTMMAEEWRQLAKAAQGLTPKTPKF
jgi:hypothetical protein